MITTECAISIYKQTVLPLLDYAVFLLHSCNVSDTDDLQVLQNDALRTCFNVKRRDQVSVKNLHTEAKLLSLKQRRIIQLLSLMFIHKNHFGVERIANRNTRAADHYRFHIERYNVVKYRNSPYYKGSE